MPEGDPVELLTPEDVRKGIAAVIGATWEQTNTGQRSRALCALYQAALKTFEILDLQLEILAELSGIRDDVERIKQVSTMSDADLLRTLGEGFENT